jgi:hypothetical protein
VDCNGRPLCWPPETVRMRACFGAKRAKESPKSPQRRARDALRCLSGQSRAHRARDKTHADLGVKSVCRATNVQRVAAIHGHSRAQSHVRHCLGPCARRAAGSIPKLDTSIASPARPITPAKARPPVPPANASSPQPVHAMQRDQRSRCRRNGTPHAFAMRRPGVRIP